jgi:hypothetical protein
MSRGGQTSTLPRKGHGKAIFWAWGGLLPLTALNQIVTGDIFKRSSAKLKVPNNMGERGEPDPRREESIVFNIS